MIVQLIAMFILGALFMACVMCIIIVYLAGHMEDEHTGSDIDDMYEYYIKEYGENDCQ